MDSLNESHKPDLDRAREAKAKPKGKQHWVERHEAEPGVCNVCQGEGWVPEHKLKKIRNYHNFGDGVIERHDPDPEVSRPVACPKACSNVKKYLESLFL